MYGTNLKSIFIGIEFNDTNLPYSQNLTKAISSVKNITVTYSFDRVNILIYLGLSLLSTIMCLVIAFTARKISQRKTVDVTATESIGKSVSFEKLILKPRPKSISC